jgi:prepilin-type N-terminal cleavage/methylation domain-containing protein
MKYHFPTRQSGFTLVEIAIVLVIIGLLLGGVLKGQAMIENAKVKALHNEFKSVMTMVYGYQDKFKALPGDDPAAPAHQPTAIQATALNAGNGQIDTGTWIGAVAPAAGNESSLFWQHVRLAELATGSVTSGQATNAVGGWLGITSNAFRVTTPANVPGTMFVCSSGISGKLARQLDIAMDDGVATTGSVFAAIETAGAIQVATAAQAYVDASTYTVCAAF